MKFTKYITSVAMLLAAASVTSCQDDYENVADNNMVFDTATDFVNINVLDGKADEMTRTLGVRIAQPQAEPVYVTYGVVDSKVEEYNAAYAAEAIILPADNYSIADPVAVVESGAIESTRVLIEFKGLAELNTDFVYVLPVSVVNSTVPVVNSTATTYYVFRGAALINVVTDVTKNYLEFVNPGNATQLSGLREITVECLVFPDSFDNLIQTLLGIEGSFLLRLGDAGLPPNQLQLAASPNATDAAWKFDAGKWTFLTFTWESATGEVNVYFNGVKKGATQKSNTGRSVNWNASDFFIGRSYADDRDFQGKMSEFRVWNRVLTPDEINERNHFYTVEPDAPGLVAYWKMNEGQGNLIHDYANGYDLTSHNPLTWISVSLPEKEK
ncbi:MAG: DUF1735 and LamG domain-containing protein [Paenibacillus sp.]|nr:DUF1735 and LamG domain-containing protein [Paenibacillus sp.]